MNASSSNLTSYLSSQLVKYDDLYVESTTFTINYNISNIPQSYIGSYVLVLVKFKTSRMADYAENTCTCNQLTQDSTNTIKASGSVDVPLIVGDSASIDIVVPSNLSPYTRNYQTDTDYYLQSNTTSSNLLYYNGNGYSIPSKRAEDMSKSTVCYITKSSTIITLQLSGIGNWVSI